MLTPVKLEKKPGGLAPLAPLKTIEKSVSLLFFVDGNIIYTKK